jgi:hypothetical protein
MLMISPIPFGPIDKTLLIVFILSVMEIHSNKLHHRFLKFLCKCSMKTSQFPQSLKAQKSSQKVCTNISRHKGYACLVGYSLVRQYVASQAVFCIGNLYVTRGILDHRNPRDLHCVMALLTCW